MSTYHYRRNYGKNTAEKSEKAIANALQNAKQQYNSMLASMANGGTWTDKEVAKVTAKLAKAQQDYNDLYGI